MFISPRLSCLEVYDEKVRDLLNKNDTNLELYKDDSGEIIVNCKEEITNSANNMLSIMKKGIKNKKILEIDRNHSHSLFRIVRSLDDSILKPLFPVSKRYFNAVWFFR